MANPTESATLARHPFEKFIVALVGIIQDEHGRVLLGLRAQEKVWVCFGGKMEHGEGLEAGLARELQEEVGLRLSPLTRLSFDDGFLPSGQQFITLYFVGKLSTGQTPVNLEPNKCLELRWFHLDELPAEMWERDRRALRSLRAEVETA
jgi:8-oxo-dGTP pyrophosphatase MutT (NUDIX family)